MEDKLTDLEEIEYLKKRLKGKTGFIIIFSILCFVFGLIVGQYIHLGGTIASRNIFNKF